MHYCIPGDEGVDIKVLEERGQQVNRMPPGEPGLVTGTCCRIQEMSRSYSPHRAFGDPGGFPGFHKGMNGLL